MRGIISVAEACNCGAGNVEPLGYTATCPCGMLLDEKMREDPAKERLEESVRREAAGMVRRFETGATRDTDEGKLDFEGFLAPGVMIRFAEYMNENRVQSDGELRDSDNWQKGIPRDQYMKSMFRHFIEVWRDHRMLGGLRSGGALEDEMETALCALMFNVMGYLFEMQQGR